ncbi:hypothetical protein ACLKA6_005536 [Drosophila palustris]
MRWHGEICSLTACRTAVTHRTQDTGLGTHAVHLQQRLMMLLFLCLIAWEFTGLSLGKSHAGWGVLFNGNSTSRRVCAVDVAAAAAAAAAADYANVLKERLRLSARQEFALQLIRTLGRRFTCVEIGDEVGVAVGDTQYQKPEINCVFIGHNQCGATTTLAGNRNRTRTRTRTMAKSSPEALMIAHSALDIAGESTAISLWRQR